MVKKIQTQIMTYDNLSFFGSNSSSAFLPNVCTCVPSFYLIQLPILFPFYRDKNTRKLLQPSKILKVKNIHLLESNKKTQTSAQLIVPGSVVTKQMYKSW